MSSAAGPLRDREVPFNKLKFEPSKGNPAAATTHPTATGATTGTTPATNANDHDYSIVQPGVTKGSLKAMTAISY